MTRPLGGNWAYTHFQLIAGFWFGIALINQTTHPAKLQFPHCGATYNFLLHGNLVLLIIRCSSFLLKVVRMLPYLFVHLCKVMQWWDQYLGIFKHKHACIKTIITECSAIADFCSCLRQKHHSCSSMHAFTLWIMVLIYTLPRKETTLYTVPIERRSQALFTSLRYCLIFHTGWMTLIMWFQTIFF